MNNFLVYLGGFMVAVLAALVGVPYAIDWNGYRGVFEEEATRVLGRDVRVAGNVGLRLLPSPYVHFEKLRIGAAPGEDTGRPLFRAEGFTMWLSVPPLLKGVLEAREVELDQPALEIVIDEEGRTSLATLVIKPEALPFVPREVALQSVRISGGSLGLWSTGEAELARLEGIKGELSADSIDGPYKFRGQLDWQGQGREVRLSTARRDPNGDVRFKAIVNTVTSGNAYVLDGAASALLTHPVVSGKLTARISTETFHVVSDPADGSDDTAAGAQAQGAHFDVAADLASEPGNLLLKDIAISLEQGGLPQLIAGEAQFNWNQPQALDVKLHSKWLDLDQLTAQGDGGRRVVPLEIARTLFDRLVDALPENAQTSVALNLDQVGLGQQVVSNLRFHASRADGPLALRDVRANLPGGTEIALDGAISGETSQRSFEGALALNGQSLSRFAAWGFGDNPYSRSGSDGPFSLEGSLALSDTAIALSEGTAEINGTPLLGELRLGLGPSRSVAIALEGHRIDMAQLWPGNPGIPALPALLVGWNAPDSEAPQDVTGNAKERGTEKNTGEILLDIKAGELIDGPRRLEDVHLEISLEDGELAVPHVKFRSSGGLALDLEGSARHLHQRPKGSLRGIIEAPGEAAVTTLAELLNVPAEYRSDVARWSTLAPLRLGATFSFGERTPDAVDVDLDGVLRGGRAVARVRLDGASTDWRDAPTDVTVSIEAADVDALLETVADAKLGAGAVATQSRAGRVFVKATGKPADGLVTLAELSAEGVKLDFSGRMTAAPGEAMAARGEVRVAADDVRRVLALAGLSLAGGVAGTPVSGTVAVAREAQVVTLASPALVLGGSSVSGVLTLRRAENPAEPRQFAAELSADVASLPVLFAALSADAPAQAASTSDAPEPEAARRRKDATAAPQPPELARRSIWPDQPFDLSPLDSVQGTIKASVRSLMLEPGLALKDARLELDVAPGLVEVKRLEGAALGGRAKALAKITRQAAGVELDGSLDIAISSTGSSENDGEDAIDGDVAALALTFVGRALSPDALVSALAGKGELSLGDVTLNGVSPQAVSEVSEAALRGEGPISGAPLVDGITSALKKYPLKLGKVAVPVELADGVLKLARVELSTSEGRAVFDTAVDLRLLTMESAWKIEGKALTRAAPSVAGAAEPEAAAPKPVPMERRSLPPLALVFKGPLASVDGMEPTVFADDLERELAVRRMERDVDELERLRRLDELRARQERARREAQEAERRRVLDEQRREEQRRKETVPAPDADGATSNGAAPTAAVPMPPPATGNAGANPLPEDSLPVGVSQDGTAAEGATAPPDQPRRTSRPAKPPPKKPVQNTWKPFQMTPYQ